MKSKILITGGTGFIGTHVINRLSKERGHEIIRGDIRDKRGLAEIFNKIDIVVHLAAMTKWSQTNDASPASLFKTNVEGTDYLLKLTALHKIHKFIFASTCGVYGDKSKGKTMDEIHPTNPVNPYTASKLAAEEQVVNFFKTSRLPTVILRLANVYGPLQRVDWMIPLFISRLIRNEPIFLNHLGKPKRDWIYIDDVIDALLLTINSTDKKLAGQVFNVGLGRAVSNREIAHFLVKALGKSKSLVKLIPAGMTESMINMAVSQKIRHWLGWKPNSTLAMGLLKTIQWFKENRSA